MCQDVRDYMNFAVFGLTTVALAMDDSANQSGPMNAVS